jgi:hypothetical protein
MSLHCTFRTWRNIRVKSAVRTKADVARFHDDISCPVSPESLLNVSEIPWRCPGLVLRTAATGKAMQSIEITDPKEARRARLAQFQGHKATLTLMGSTVTGLVRSVKEDTSSAPPRWIVTFVATQTVAA